MAKKQNKKDEEETYLYFEGLDNVEKVMTAYLSQTPFSEKDFWMSYGAIQSELKENKSSLDPLFIMGLMAGAYFTRKYPKKVKMTKKKIEFFEKHNAKKTEEANKKFNNKVAPSYLG